MSMVQTRMIILYKNFMNIILYYITKILFFFFSFELLLSHSLHQKLRSKIIFLTKYIFSAAEDDVRKKNISLK